MNERKSFQNGITLIALVISIIVMLILAGVSLNATIGDNGIITQAQNANRTYAMSILEEFLQEKYVELYNKMDTQSTEIDYLLNDLSTKKYIQKSKSGDYFFLDANTGNAYYFIEKSELPDDIKSILPGGDTSLSGNSIWIEFDDIYGITSDLKVYYCSNGSESRIGAEDENINVNLTDKKVLGMEQGSDWAKAMGFDKNVTLQDLTTVTELTITDSNLDLKLAYNLGKLTKLTFKNVKKADLSGLGEVSSLQYVMFEKSEIDDYSALSECKNLKHLYLYLPSTMEEENANLQVANLCDSNKGIGKAELPKLEYFGVFGVDETYREIEYSNYIGKYSNISKVSDINPLENLQSKKYIKYLFLNGTSIKNLKSLKDFSNLEIIVMHNINGYENFEGISNKSNLKKIYAQYGSSYNLYGLENNGQLNYLRLSYDKNLITLSGINNCNNLKTIYADGCNLGLNEDSTNSTEQDALYSIKDLNLNIINLENNQLKWVGYLKKSTDVKSLYLNGNNNIVGDSLVEIANLIKKCGNNQTYPSKYSLLLLDDSTTNLSLKSENVNVDNFKTLKGKSNIIKLDLQNLKLTKTSGNIEVAINENEYNEILNDVLATLTKMKYLNLNDISGLNTISFVTNMNELCEICLENTNVTTGTEDARGKNTGLELLNNIETMRSLAINNNSIDLSKITQTLNRFRSGFHSDYNYFNNIYALKCTIENLKTLNNPNCELDNLCLTSFPAGEIVDLSNCITLKSYSSIYERHQGNVKLPNSVEKIYLDTSYIYGNFPENLKTIYFHHTLENDVLKNLSQNCMYLESIQTDCNNVTDLSSLTTAVFKNTLQILKLRGDSSHQAKPCSLKNLNGLEGFNKLQTLHIEYSELGDITGLKNCTELKTLIIKKSKLKDISSLINFNSIEEIYLDENSIGSLHGIENLVNLKILSITNNAIGDLTQYEDNGTKTVTNASIIAKLHTSNGGKLKKIYLDNNPITEVSEISKLKWEDKNGF